MLPSSVMSSMFCKREFTMNLKCSKWIERYRPDHVKDVIVPKKYRKFFDDIVTTKDLPNLFLYGKKGTGKTSMALALIKDLNAQVFEINSSTDGRMDVLKEKLTNWARTKAPNNEPKIIFLDEFDGCSPAFQAGLRKLMEETALKCSYIMTCNFPTKVIDALQEGRTMEFNFNFPEKEDQESMKELIAKRIFGILKYENVDYDPEAVKRLIELKGNSIRTTLSMLQKYVRIHGKIDSKIAAFADVDDKIIDLIKEHNYSAVMDLIDEKGYQDVDVYEFLFERLAPICPKKGSAILTIGQYESAGATSRLPRVQMACCIVSLCALF